MEELDVAVGVVGVVVGAGADEVRASRTGTNKFSMVGIVVNLLWFQSPIVD